MNQETCFTIDRNLFTISRKLTLKATSGNLFSLKEPLAVQAVYIAFFGLPAHNI